jgi:uncharacterized protein
VPPLPNAESETEKPPAHLSIKVVPNAPQSAVAGWLGDVLKVKLKAPPLEGKANAELARFLAVALGLPRSGIVLTGGKTSRVKQVAIHGLTPSEVRARLGA